MRAKTFTVPFSAVVGEDAKELDFGPDDYLVVRPLFGLPATDVRQWSERINAFSDLEGEAAAKEADKIILDAIGTTVIEWSLVGEDGKPIDKPKTAAALNALPAVIRGALFTFLTQYRGDDKHPTTRS